ncbi:MAG: MSCRAMM family protein [Solirubrobacteraceae bacterium]
MEEANLKKGLLHRGRAQMLLGACLVALCGALAAPLAAQAATTSITGKVTSSPESGEGVAGVEVCAFEVATETKLSPCATSTSSGEYTVDLAAGGEYKLRFAKSGFATGWYVKAHSWSEATPVSVKSGETTPGVDVELVEEGQGTLSGAATDAASNQGIAGIEVCVYGKSSLNEFVYRCPGAETGAGGQYTISGLPVGNYTVSFFPASNCEEELGEKLRCNPKVNYVSNFSASPLRVKANQTTTDNVSLRTGGEISGTVTNASITHPPIAKLEVCATKVNGSGEVPYGKPAEEEKFEYAFECGYTNASGQYTIMALPSSGSYKLEFNGTICTVVQKGKSLECPEAYVSQYYPGKASFRTATPVTVTVGQTTGGINETLREAFPVAPANTAAPTATGAATVGSTLTCSQGTWAHEPLFLTYQWLANGTPIGGQIGTTYAIQVANQGQSISCDVLAGNGAGVTSATSNAVAVPAPLPPPPPPKPKPKPLTRAQKLHKALKRCKTLKKKKRAMCVKAAKKKFGPKKHKKGKHKKGKAKKHGKK